MKKAFLSAAAVVAALALPGSPAFAQANEIVIGITVTTTGPAAALGGGVQIGARSYVALGARVRDHVTIGEDSVVGMGAAVVRTFPARSRLLGVPAREVGHG